MAADYTDQSAGPASRTTLYPTAGTRPGLGYECRWSPWKTTTPPPPTTTSTTTTNTTTTTLRFVDNGDGTVTDNQTGLQWEQKTGSVGTPRICKDTECPASDTFVGTYTASAPCGGGSFTIMVDPSGTTWTGSSVDSNLGCSGSSSGAILGFTLTGTGPFGVMVNGTVDCDDAVILGTLSGPVSGSWFVSRNDCPDPHDVNNLYPWSDSSINIQGTAPNGPAFTDFLGKLNNCTSGNGTTMHDAGFAGHCDWRLPSIVELHGIVDLNATGCGSGSPCINQTVFGPTVAGNATFNYWSATTGASDPSSAWIVSFNDGSVGRQIKDVGQYVRAVRAGSCD